MAWSEASRLAARVARRSRRKGEKVDLPKYKALRKQAERGVKDPENSGMAIMDAFNTKTEAHDAQMAKYRAAAAKDPDNQYDDMGRVRKKGVTKNSSFVPATNMGVKGMKKGIRKPKPLAKGKVKAAIHPKLAQIAKEHLGVDTLERRGMDRHDFHDQATWTLAKGMHAAYAHGAGNPDAKLSDDEVEEMGKKHFGRETMKTRKSDSLDFQQESVWGMHAALSDAMQRGKASRKKIK